MPIIIEEKSDLGCTLKLTVPDTFIKKGANKDIAATYLDIAYRPFIHKLIMLLEYTIGTGDYDTIELFEEIISNIAKEKLKGK